MTGIVRTSDTLTANPSFFIAMNIKDINALLADLSEQEQKKIKAVIFKEYRADTITPADVQRVRAAVLGGEIVNQYEKKSAVKTSGRRAASKSAEISSAASVETMTEKSAEIIPENTQQLKNDGTYTVDELIPRIESALKDFNALNDVEDWKKETLTRWHGACMYIGRSLFKNTRILRDIDRRDPAGTGYTNFNAYDYDLISDLLDYYSILCSRVNKPVTLWGFAYFIGTDSYTVREMRDRLSPSSKAAFEKVWELQERSLTDRAIQGGGVTLIATLNHVHGWDGSQREQKTDNSGSLGVQSLPRLTDGER